MARALSSFSLGLPESRAESRFVEKFDQDWHLCLIFSVVGTEVRSVISSLAEYFESSLITDAQSLYEVVSSAVANFRKEGLEISVGASLIKGQDLTVCSYNAGAFLLRNNKKGALLLQKPSVQIIEGQSQPMDTIVLYTATAYEQLSSVFSKRIELANISQFAHDLQKTFRRMNTSGSMAVGFTTLPKTAELGIEKKVRNPAGAQTVSSKIIRYCGVFVRFLLSMLLKFIRLVIKTPTKFFSRVKGIQPILHPTKTYVGFHVSRKTIFIVFIVLFGIVLISSATVISISKSQEEEEQILQQLEPFSVSLEQIKLQSQVEPAQAYVQVQQLIQDMGNAQLSLDSTEKPNKQVVELLREAQLLAQQLSESQILDELPLYDDFRTVSPTFISSSIASSQEMIYALDAQQQYLIQYHAPDRVGEQISLDSDLQLKTTSILEGDLLLLGAGIFRLEKGSVSPTQLLDDSDAVQAGQFIGSYNQFVYLLDPTARAIFRYEVKNNQLSNRSTWIGSSSGVPFQEVSSMVIDGDIWLGLKSGSITRMRSGRTVPFQIEGLSTPPTSPLYVATTIDSPLLYVLEPANSRAFSVKKDTGEVVNQVENRSLGSASGIIFLDIEQQVLVVSGSILFQLPL